MLDFVLLELRYKASQKLLARDKCGAWKSGDKDVIRRIEGAHPTPLNLTAIAARKPDALRRSRGAIDARKLPNRDGARRLTPSRQ